MAGSSQTMTLNVLWEIPGQNVYLDCENGLYRVGLVGFPIPKGQSQTGLYYN